MHELEGANLLTCIKYVYVCNTRVLLVLQKSF